MKKRDKLGKFIPNPINEKAVNFKRLDACYWAGFFAADGYMGKKYPEMSIGLSIKDISQIKGFQKFLGLKSKIGISIIKSNERIKSNRKAVRLNFSNSYIYDKFLSLNITNKKSLTLKPPPLKGKYAIAFIIGFIDGDGCITGNKHLHLSILGTDAMITWAKDTLNSYFKKNLGSIHSYKATPGLSVVSYSSGIARELLKFVEKHKFHTMGRKWDRVRTYVKKFPTMQVIRKVKRNDGTIYNNLHDAARKNNGSVEGIRNAIFDKRLYKGKHKFTYVK